MRDYEEQSENMKNGVWNVEYRERFMGDDMDGNMRMRLEYEYCCVKNSYKKSG